MHAYPLYRLNRLGAALIMTMMAVVGVLVAPIRLVPAGTATSTTPAVASSPAHLADPAAIVIAAQQHVTLAQAEIRLSWQQATPPLNAVLSRELRSAFFGGIWIDPNDGDRVKIGVVGSDP